MTSTTQTGVPVGARGERLHALDALRAVAMMLGVWLHAALPFVAGVPFFFWPFLEPTKSTALARSVTVIHTWRMETFFLLSGFFTAMLIARRGGMATLRQRAVRVLVPFLIAMVTIQPLCAFVWAWGYSEQWGWPLQTTFTNVLKNAWGVDTPGAPGAFGRLYHLWFLYDLCILIGAGLLLRFVALRLMPAPLARFLVAAWHGNGRLLAWLAGSWLGAIALAVPVLTFLLLHGPNGAEPNPALMPAWKGLLYYAVPFFGGWMLYAHRGFIDRLGRRWWAPMLIAVAATVVHVRALGILGTIVEGQEARAAAWWSAMGSRAVMTAGYTLGLIGLFTFLFSRPGPRLQAAVRWVSDSAYWVYLAHLPLVIAFGILLLPWQAPVWAKFGVCVTGSMAVLLVSYALLVRHTPIGWLLNGRRARRAASGPNPDAPTPANRVPAAESA